MIKGSFTKEQASAVEKDITLTGSYQLNLSPESIWQHLNDPEILRFCIKGCDQVNKLDPEHFDAIFRFRLGPFRRIVKAKLQVVSQVGDQYSLKSTVSASPLGGAVGEAQVSMRQNGQDTTLAYTATVQVEGWFAKLGARLVREAANRYMTRFFTRFESRVKEIHDSNAT